MKRYLTALAFCLVFVFSNVCFAQGYFFDFGAEDSPVEDGFTKVTENSLYAKDAGAGWICDDNSKAAVKSCNENARVRLTYLNLDPILCDHITSNKTFRLDLPEGNYIVAIFMGQMTYAPGKQAHTEFWKGNYSVEINKNKVITNKDMPDWLTYLKSFYKANEEEFLAGDNLFDKYVKPYYKVKTFPFSGNLEITFSATCPVNALMVYPADMENELKQKISELRDRQRKWIDSIYEDLTPKSGTLPENIKDKYSDPGYVIYPINEGIDKAAPTDLPKESDIEKSIASFVSQGELAVVPFRLCALRKLENLEISISELKNESGDTISEKTSTLWKSYFSVKSVKAVKKQGFYIYPAYAFPYVKQDLRANQNFLFYIYINTSEDVLPGMYYGNINVSVNGSVEKSHAIKLRVLPLKLKEPDMHLGWYCHHPRNYVFRGISGNDKIMKMSRLLMENMFRQMKMLGYNTASLILPKDPFVVKNGKVEKNQIKKGWTAGDDVWQMWVDTIDSYQKIMGDKPLSLYGIGQGGLLSKKSINGFYTGHEEESKKAFSFSEQTKKDIETLISYFYDEVRKHNWPEILFYNHDELGSLGLRGAKYGVEFDKIIRPISRKVGFRTCASLNGTDESQAVPYLDIAAINSGYSYSEQSFEYIRSTGCELWYYNGGATRFNFGYFLVKHKPKGRLQWDYGYGPHMPFLQIQSLPTMGFLDWAAVLNSEFDLAIRYSVEECRQGIVDYRYYITLENLVRENKDSKKEKMANAVVKAEKLLNKIKDGIKTDILYYSHAGPWTIQTCQRLRWAIANAIMEVQNAKQ